MCGRGLERSIACHESTRQLARASGGARQSADGSGSLGERGDLRSRPSLPQTQLPPRPSPPCSLRALLGARGEISPDLAVGDQQSARLADPLRQPRVTRPAGRTTMPLARAVLWVAAALACGAVAQYSSDLCSWRGSGLSHESHRRDVEQVYLRCSQGSLEWLYPTGAIIVNLRPNTEPPSGRAADLHACIRPHAYSQGSHVYLERAGDLTLLLAERGHAQGTVRCFRLTEGALFVEAVPPTDISRRITAFQYELVPGQGPGVHMYPFLHPGLVSCKPCSDEEVLMAVCTSDFAGSGVFRGAAPGAGGRSRVVVTLSRLFRQKGSVFAWSGARGRAWSGRISVPAQCGVHVGDDEYLLTGFIHFDEAWLGCAPRYKDFLELYIRAQESGANPCQVNTD